MRFSFRLLVVAFLLAALSVGVAACGDSGDTTGSETTAESGGSGGGPDVEAAKEFVKPYEEGPTPFPVTEPLKEVPKGATISYLSIPNPIAELQWAYLQEAGKTMGVTVKRVVAGEGAQGISSAMDTIVSEKPDGVILVAADPVLYSKQLKELQDAGTAIAASSIVNGDEFGLENVSYGAEETTFNGGLMLAWLIASGEGGGEDFAFYNTPELAFSPFEGEGAKSKLEELCPSCTLRTVDLTVPELGSAAFDKVVSDLQANPDTAGAVFNADFVQDGLPVSLKTAGIELDSIGPGPTPNNLKQVKSGEQAGTLAVSLPIQLWTLLDQIARQLAGQEQTGGEAKGELVKQLLDQEALTDIDPAKGWNGYDDYQERFAKLWKGEG